MNQNNNLEGTNYNKKKSNKLIIVLIISLILLGGIFFFVSGNVFKTQNNEKSTNGKTSDNTSLPNIESDTIWINEAIGITYNLPKKTELASFNGSSSFKYIHGSSFEYNSSYKIYVDKSLEGHKNLETLASDIIGEKQSDKYRIIYNFGSKFLKEFKNNVTKKVKIGKYNAVYFESEELDAVGAYGNNLKIKIVGYSFKYNNEYISIYGELPVSENDKLSELKEKMEYIIKTINTYDEKSLQELDGNVKEYYDDGFTNAFNDGVDRIFTINYYSPHTLNGILRQKNTISYINKNDFTWDGTTNNILNQLLTHKYPSSLLKFYNTAYNKSNKEYETLYDILNEDTVKINGIDFKKYTLKAYNNTDKTSYKILVVYFFVVDNNPYLLQYSLDSSIYNIKDKLTEEDQKNIIDQTELIAKSYIHTFRILNNDEKYSTFVHLY